VTIAVYFLRGIYMVTNPLTGWWRCLKQGKANTWPRWRHSRSSNVGQRLLEWFT